MSTGNDAEDILNDALEFLGGQPIIDNSIVKYGDLTLTTARKEGKANTLLADHLFSPGLFLAERIERGLLEIEDRTVLEFGAGTGLPSLLAATIRPTPSLVVVTDYPDENILGNLQSNIDRNKQLFHPECSIRCAGYEWGQDAQYVKDFLAAGQVGFDVLILSDLLHFDSCHDILITSIRALLRRSKRSTVYVAAGNYTRPSVCDGFLLKGAEAGLVFEEIIPTEEEKPWLGSLEVVGLSQEDLTLRKLASLSPVAGEIGMGISGLLPNLKCIQVSRHLKEYAGQRIAVDAYVWLHRGVMTCATELATGKATHKYVDYAMHRVRILRHHKIEPYIVFDGGPLPAKKGTESGRKQRRDEYLTRANALTAQGKHSQAREFYAKCVDVTPQMAYQFIKALRAENVDYVVAPYEADAQMAYLERMGLVDAILTEDSDLLVFGCQNVLFKLDTVANTVISISRKDFGSVCRPKSEISLVEWSDSLFRAMAILSGCDYLPSIPGIGLKTACSLLRKWKTPDQVVRAVMLEGKKSVPRGYMDQFRLADRCFQHQRVYCPIQEELVYLTDIPEVWDEASEAYVGGTIAKKVAQKIATGDVDPVTLLPMEDINPEFSPRSRTDGVSATSRQVKRDKGKGKAPELPPSNGGILSFFGANPIFPGRASHPATTRITASNGSVGKSSGKRTLAQVMDDEVSMKKHKSHHISKFFATPRQRQQSPKETPGPSRRSPENKENEYIIIDDEDELDIDSNLSTTAQGYVDRGMELEIEEILTHPIVDQEEGYISPVNSNFGDTDDLSSPIRPRHTPNRKRAAASEDRDFGVEAVSSPPSVAKPHHHFPNGLPADLQPNDSDFGERDGISISFPGLDLRHAFHDQQASDIEDSDDETAAHSGSGGNSSATPASSPPTPFTHEDEVKYGDSAARYIDCDFEDEIIADKERRTQAVISGWKAKWSRKATHSPHRRTLEVSPNLFRRETNVTPAGRQIALGRPTSKSKPPLWLMTNSREQHLRKI